MSRRFPPLVPAIVLAVSVAAACVLVRTSHAARSSESIPLIAEGPSYTYDSGTPLAVRARLDRNARKALELLRQTSKLTPSIAAGCKPNDFPNSLGPPAPGVNASIFGHHIEVVVRFNKLPNSLACRPWGVLISTRGLSVKPKVGPMPWTLTYQLAGPVGRAVIKLPNYAKPPYTLSVTAGTIQGRPSKRIEQTLRCPSAGCLRGEAPALHEAYEPRPRFPLRNITRSQLEGSFNDGLDAIARAAPYMRHTVHCPNLTTCDITYTDPLYPKQPYRTRYQISGEQTPGCWLVLKTRAFNTPPYEGIFARGPEAGCISWPS